MATYTKRLLSNSTNGKQIKVAATTTAGTAIHTAVAGTGDLDEVWLWAVNNHTVTVELCVEFGGATDPDDLICVSLPARQGLVLVVPGLLLQNGLGVAAFAGVANVVSISGFVNRITA
jgi:hypothetical protein